MNALRLFWVLALRNVLAHRVKSLIVGSILGFGTFLVVTGSAVLDSVEASMARSITSSLSGDAQVYQKDTRDELALFGGGAAFGATDIGDIDDIGPMLTTIEQVPGVEAVVPMGIANATVFNGTELDRVLERLRVAARAGDVAGERILGEQVRGIAATLRKDLEAQVLATSDKVKVEQDLAALDRVLSPAFWTELEADPLPALDWIDSNVAPLASDGRLLFVRALGTDLDTYVQHFDRFKIVKGTAVPPGVRGFLFADRFYERQVKNKVARDFDALIEDLDEGKTIAAEALLQDNVRRMAEQYPRVLFQLDPAQVADLTTRLRAELGRSDGDAAALLQQFLTVDDTNARARHTRFYELIGPMIRLYEAPVGEVMTVRAFTRSGYIRSVQVMVYGTFEFQGLESSDLASATNLTDLVTFRLLYGKMTEAQKAELTGIRARAEVREVSRENAEDALFGGGDEAEAVAEAPVAGAGDAFAIAEAVRAAPASDAVSDRVDPRDFRQGLALNAAVLFEDGVSVDAGIAAVQSALDAAGLNLRTVDWQTAAGIVGQLILVLRVVLWVAIFIIFLVALFIINNSMVMTTLERVTEIGTMRAIGARRSWVTGLFLTETVVLGTVAGGLGAGMAVAFLLWLGQVGIGAPIDVMVLLFAGPRLYPVITLGNVLFGLASVVGVSLLSTLYPAVLAARVQPVVAMTQKE